MNFSEDDIRSKVVYQWLKDCGFSEQQLHIEFSINLRLGKGIRTIHSRTDVLVKSISGNNLLIIEVKKRDHSLVEADQQQAISYARSLADGGIAPFTILTNGKDTRIFDSITGAEITGDRISSTHPYVKNGFRVTGDGIVARAEALEYLITLSGDNLLTFCKAQVEHRMTLLKDEDPFSGKKYIPKLYTERKAAKEELQQKLFKDEPKREVVLVIGPPQHGKTCFLCRSVEELLEQNIPCLFYPAIALRKGLLTEMQEDFQWTFGEAISPIQLAKRLNNIIEKTGQQMVIVVDGWNEMVNNALTINDECQRLQHGKIQLLLSTTSPSLTRLLQDEADNLTHIANSVNLNIASIRKLTSQPLHSTKNLGVVQIGKFEYDELEEARTTYENAFNVTFEYNSNLPKDPFYLRLASEEYANQTVPAFATRTQLIKNSLVRKGARRNIQEIELFRGLSQIAQIASTKDVPFSCVDLPQELAPSNTLCRWIESAILIHLPDTTIPAIDFYYTHERDYCIAILNKKWHSQMEHATNHYLKNELQDALKTEASKSALRWFLSSPEYVQYLERFFSFIDLKADKEISKILSELILRQVNFNNNLSFTWLEPHIQKLLLLETGEASNLEELGEFIYSFIVSLDKKKDNEKFNFWIRLLLKYDHSIQELGIDESFVKQVYAGEEEIRGYLGYGDDLDYEFDIELFELFVLDRDIQIAKNAALILAYVCPYRFLEKIPEIAKYYHLQKHSDINDLIYEPCRLMLGELHEKYVGSMCPGWFDSLEKGDEEIVEEFEEQKRLWRPVLQFVQNSKLHSCILEHLQMLSENALINDLEREPNIYNPNQLKFDL